MKVRELIDTIEEHFRENLWMIVIDENDIDDVIDLEGVEESDLEKEVKEWYIDYCLDGQFFYQRLTITTKEQE